MKKHEAEYKQQSGYISSFAKNFHEQEIGQNGDRQQHKQIHHSNNPNSEHNEIHQTEERTESINRQQLSHVALEHLNDREKEALVKIEQKIGRPLNELEKIDAIEHIIYEPDRIAVWLEEENITDPAKLATHTPKANRSPKTESVPVKIENLNSRKKIALTIKKASSRPLARNRSKTKFSIISKTLAIMTSILCILTVFQFLVASNIINPRFILIILAAISLIFIIIKSFAIFKDLIGFANAVNATTEADLDVSAKHLSASISKLNIHLIFSWFTKIKTNKSQ